MRLLPLLTMLALATPALAQETPSQVKKADPNRQICRRVMETGTILGGKRECHTKAEWAQLEDRARNDRDNRNRNRGDDKISRNEM